VDYFAQAELQILDELIQDEHLTLVGVVLVLIYRHLYHSLLV
jgi:hypothetical protein